MDAIADIADLTPGFNLLAPSSYGNFPGVQQVADAIGDFAKTSVGRLIATAVATTLYGALAVVVGPQLASIAFAFPGLLRGDSFSQSWIEEFSSRVHAVAEIMGPDIAAKVGDELQDALGKITDKLGSAASSALDDAGLSDFANEALGDVASLLPNLATATGLREDALVYAKSLANQIPIPKLDIVAATGEVLAIHLPSGTVTYPHGQAAAATAGFAPAPAPAATSRALVAASLSSGSEALEEAATYGPQALVAASQVRTGQLVASAPNAPMYSDHVRPVPGPAPTRSLPPVLLVAAAVAAGAILL